MVVQLQPSSSAASTDKSAIALPEINLQDDDELEFFSEEADSSPGSNNNNNNTATATTTTTNNNNNRNKNKLDASKYTKEQLDTIKRTDYYGLWIHLDYSRCKSYLLSDLIPFKEGLGTHHPPPEFRTSYLKVEEWREMTAEEQISYKEKKKEEELSLKAAQAISSFGSNNSNKNKKNNTSNAKKLDAYQYTKEQIDTMKSTDYERWVDLDYSKCKSALLCELFPFIGGLGTYHPPMEFRTSSVKVCEWRKMTDAEQKSYKDKKKEEDELIKMEAARKKREERDRKRSKLAMEQQEKAAMSLSNMPNMVGYYYGDDQDIQDYYSQQWDTDKPDKSNIKYNKKRKVRKDKKQQNIEKTVVSKIPSLRARLLEEEEQLKLAQQQLDSAQEQVDATRAALEKAEYEEQQGGDDKANIMKERNNKVRNNVVAICNANGVAQKASAQCRYVVARIPQIMTTKDDDGLYKDAFSPNYFRQILKGEKDLKGKKLAMLEMFCEENKLEQ